MSLAPIYTNFEGERAPKKNAIFLSKFFKKCPKTAFLTVFSKIRLRRRKFCQNRGKTVLWESSKNQFGRPKKKKKVVKILENFLKIRPPPLEKILDLPAELKKNVCASIIRINYLRILKNIMKQNFKMISSGTCITTLSLPLAVQNSKKF